MTAEFFDMGSVRLRISRPFRMSFAMSANVDISAIRRDWERMRKLSKKLALAAAVAVLGWSGTANSGPMVPVPGDPVTLTSGRVSGTLLANGVKAYLGVPFAKPPVNELRWREPQPITWKGIWNADTKAPECIQVLRPHDINHYFGEEPTSEDCLYMNIWTPVDAKAGDDLPVVVFIYGGGGTIGSSGMANYDGANMARRGAVFVNFNYRLGLLGFMAHPELTLEQGGHSGNYAYLDQSAALRWIRDNIAQFGGDPDKVVISGQSAGASSVAAQYTSPLSKGLFRGAMMSSSCNLAGATDTLQAGEQVGLEAQRLLNAGNLAAMRNVPADRILALQAESQIGMNTQGLRARPVIDGYFWPGTKEQLFANGQASLVPIIATSNGGDSDFGSNPLTQTRTAAEFQATAREMYGAKTDQFLRLFPVASDAEVRPMAQRAAIETGMLQNSRTCGDILAKHGTAPAYIGVFDRKHPYSPGVTLADQDVATIGAYHNADVPYWFDTLDNYNILRTTRVPQPWDRALIDAMSSALITFAETGSPSTSAYAWPAYSAAAPQFAWFGDTISTQSLNLQRMDWLASNRSQMAVAPTPIRPRD